MQTEIEIKFLVADPALGDPADSMANKLDIFLNSLTIVSHSEVELGNIYFDTRDLALRRLDMGLRIRRSDDFAEQTIKCRGEGLGGLHARPEYNGPVRGERPCLADFPASIWPQGEDLAALQAALVPQFRTDFLRRHWLIAWQGAEIELAWDRGEIVGQEGREAIDELELELKSGSPAALLALAERLGAMPGLRLGVQSKAQRGYRLAGLGKALVARALPQPGDLDALSPRQRIQLGLEQWQHHEQICVLQQDMSAWPGLVAGLALIGQAVAHSVAMGESAPEWGKEMAPLLADLAQLDEAGRRRWLARADYVVLQLAIIAWLRQ